MKKKPIATTMPDALPNLLLEGDMAKINAIQKSLPPNATAAQAIEALVSNGLGDAIGFTQFNPFGFPQNQGNGFTDPTSSVNTIFKNLRWYLVSNFRQVLSQVYVEIGLVQTIVDVPVDDALRGGVEIKSKQLDDDQIEELQISLDRDDDINTIGQAAKWNRLFGGAGVIILTDQDPETELELTSISKDTPLEFRAVDLWELFWDKQNTEGYDPSIQTQDFEFYSYYGEQLHKSRVMRMKGSVAPSFIRPRLRGWGFSVVETLVRSINQYLKATDLTFQVLDEFKVDIYKIKNLVNTLLSPNGQQKIAERVRMANWQKNFQNAVVMDSEDDWDHKQLSFTGLAEAMDGIRMQVAADMRIPRSKLFGEAGGGLNSGSNEGDLEVYNAMVESQVRNKIKYDILRVCEFKCQKMFGFVPDDLSLTFKPLRVLNGEQEENVKEKKFNRLFQSLQGGAINEEEFRDAANKGGLFDILLDTSVEMLNPPQDDVTKEGDQDPDAPKKDTGDPGANREDTEKSKTFEYSTMPKPASKKNSAAFDRASYEADGGDGWIHPGREEFFTNPGNVDEQLWTKAKDASTKAFGKVKWQFVAWWYKKQGGTFS